MPDVSMPDGSIVSMPDNPSPELKQRIRDKIAKMKPQAPFSGAAGHQVSTPAQPPAEGRIATDERENFAEPLRYGAAHPEELEKLTSGGKYPTFDTIMRHTAIPAADIALTAGRAVGKAVGAIPATAAIGNIIEGVTGDPAKGDRAQGDAQMLRDTMMALAGQEAPGAAGKMGVKRPSAGATLDKGLAAWFGRDPEAAKLAMKNADAGLAQAPGSYLKNAPRMQRTIEMSRKLGYDPTAKAGADLAERGARKALEDTGMSVEEAQAAKSGVRDIAEPSYENSGEAVKNAAQGDFFALHKDVEADTADIQTKAKMVGQKAAAGHLSDMVGLQKQIAGHEAKAQSMIDQGWSKLKELQGKPGNVAEDVAKQVDGLLQETKGVANEMYGWSRDTAGDVAINTKSAAASVQNLLQDMPEELFQANPRLRRSIEALSGGTMPFGELQNLRSSLRDMSFSDKLSPDLKRGPLKYMSGVVNDLLTRGAPADKGQIAQLREGRKLLSQADTFYARNMPKFQDAGLQQLVGNLKTGLAPDAEKVAGQIAHSDNRNLRQQVLAIAGRQPGLVERIRNADFQGMVRDARSPATGELDTGKLLRAVDDRARSGVLQDYYGPQAGAIQQLTRRVAQQSGKLDLEVGPKDNFVSALSAATRKQAELKELAKTAPQDLMEQALAEGDKRIKGLGAQADTFTKEDPLMGLRSAKAEAAAKALLDDPMRLRTALQRWGEGSQALTLLRQEAVKNLIAPVVRGGGGNTLSAGLARLKPEVQAMLFPNGLGEDLQVLAKQLDFIHGEGTGSMPGLAAGEALDKPLHKYLVKAKTYEIAARLITHPKIVRLLAGGLRRGGAQAVEARNKLLEFAYQQTARQSADDGHETDHGTPKTFSGDWRSLVTKHAAKPKSDWRKLVRPQR